MKERLLLHIVFNLMESLQDFLTYYRPDRSVSGCGGGVGREVGDGFQAHPLFSKTKNNCSFFTRI